jgi:hypothetical protein
MTTRPPKSTKGTGSTNPRVAFDESKHPRHPKGHAKGGQFKRKVGGSRKHERVAARSTQR